MFELTRKYEFHAARKLTSLPESHPCSKMHGHTFSVIVKISNHTYLNDIDTLSNPTTEHIVVWIWDKLLPDLNGLTEVTVSESNDSSCTYKGNN